MQTVNSHIIGKISTKDWELLLQQMEFILATEGELARYLAEHFREISGFAETNPPGETRKMIVTFRNAIISEREKLIKQEIELYAIV